MAITLRGNKSTALTFNELDGNFTDLNGRVTTIEGSYITSVNGITTSTKAITINTSQLTEDPSATVSSGTMYYTDARSRAAVSVTDSGGDGSLTYNSSTGVITYTGPSASEVRAKITVTDAGGDGSLAYNNSTGVLTYTGPSLTEVQARIASTSITALSDVLSTTLNSPTNGHGLVYSAASGKLELAELPGAAGGQNNTGSSVGTGIEVFQSKVGVDLRFRKLNAGGGNISLTQNTNDIDIDVVDTDVI